jgi:uncharacterized protein YdiU (UPF0061 family)
MQPTDSMEKLPTVERTGRPIAVFSNSYARLPERFFARLAPTPATKPRLIKFNESLASELGVNAQGLEPDEVAAVFAGNVTPPGAEPIAMAYARHQFGNFVPQLGDGRAILLGEVLDRNGERRDVQLKGAGRTPFSRRGDGRAALGRSCANISSAKRCMRSEFRPHGRWRQCQPVNQFIATASYREPC